MSRYRGWTNQATHDVSRAVLHSPNAVLRMGEMIRDGDEFNMSSALIHAMKVVPNQRTDTGFNVYDKSINWAEVADYWNKVAAPDSLGMEVAKGIMERRRDALRDMPD